MSAPRRHFGLHHLALRVRDVSAIRHFYVDLLKFGVEREVPGRELWLTSGSDSLVFLEGEPGRPDHFGLMVQERGDVSAWEAHLKAAGVVILEPTEAYDDGSVGMICQDPAGHAVQLLWHPLASKTLERTQSF